MMLNGYIHENEEEAAKEAVKAKKAQEDEKAAREAAKAKKARREIRVAAAEVLLGAEPESAEEEVTGPTEAEIAATEATAEETKEEAVPEVETPDSEKDK
jgi:hypothetical protein